jgi:hypothetical protein
MWERNERELELFSWKDFFKTMDEAPAPDTTPTSADPVADDVMTLRMVASAQSLACRVLQRLDDRFWEIHPHAGTPVICFDLPAVRAWLRHYGQCGRYGRRCTDAHGQHICFVGDLTFQCALNVGAKYGLY